MVINRFVSLTQLNVTNSSCRLKFPISPHIIKKCFYCFHVGLTYSKTNPGFIRRKLDQFYRHFVKHVTVKTIKAIFKGTTFIFLFCQRCGTPQGPTAITSSLL